MINKKTFEEEILAEMESNLQPISVKTASNKLNTAVEYLNSAAEIFENAGLTSKSDAVLSVLLSFSALVNANKKKKSKIKTDPHTKGLTPDKMVKNLLDHGTEFNMADDLLDSDINDADLEVIERELGTDMDFEDEV